MHTPTALILLALASLPLVSPTPDATQGDYFTTSDGVRLHYIEAGEGPPIVLVPGWLNSTTIWEPQLERLARTHRVVALDPRSQGGSERTGQGLNPERRSRDIAELIEHRKLSPVLLVGFSMGAYEVLSYVDQFGTERLCGIALVDQPIGHDLALDGYEGFVGFVRQFNANREQLLDGFMSVAFKQPQPQAYLARIRNDALSVEPAIAIGLLAAYLGRDWRPTLAKLDKPVLYTITEEAVGFLGQVSLLEQARLLKAEVASARIEVFPEAGHVIFADEPDRFHRVLVEFTDDCFKD